MKPIAAHHRSIRLKGFDYSQENAFFVTICAFNRSLIFGKIIDGTLIHSNAGEIVIEEWIKTETLRAYVKLDQFVMMPNHFHGILMIEGQEEEGTACQEGTARRAPTMQKFGKPVAKSLPTIIGSFKSAVARRINETRGTPGAQVWQRNYYEHVIRDEPSLNRIREYIINNPLRWELDRENPHRKGEDGFYRWLASFKTRPK